MYMYWLVLIVLFYDIVFLQWLVYISPAVVGTSHPGVLRHNQWRLVRARKRTCCAQYWVYWHILYQFHCCVFGAFRTWMSVSGWPVGTRTKRENELRRSSELTLQRCHSNKVHDFTKQNYTCIVCTCWYTLCSHVYLRSLQTLLYTQTYSSFCSEI